MKRIVSFVAVVLASSLLFASLTVGDLEGMVKTNNGSLKQADEKVRAAGLDLKDAKANFSPSITFTGTATYMANPPLGQITMESSEILSQMGLGNVPGANGYVTLYDGMDNTLLMGSLSLTQPIFTWGKLTDAVSLYGSALSATSFQRDDKLSQLLSELHVRVWALKYMEELSSILDETEALAEELVEMAKKAYETGLSVKTDYLSAKVSSNETAMRTLELEKERSEMLSALRLLVGDATLSLSDIEYPEGEEEILSRYRDAVLDELVSEAIGTSLNLKAARELLSVYSLQEKIARKSLYGIPDFALQASLGYGGSKVPLLDMGWRQSDDYSLTLTLAFTTTLWDGGKLMNSVEKAKVNVASTTALLSDAELQIRNAVESNLTALEYARSNEAYLESRLEVAEEELSALEIEYRYGNKGRREIVEKELAIAALKAELVAQKITAVQNVFTLDYLTGRI